MKFNYFLLQLLLVFNLAKARQQIENCISYLVVYMDPQNQQLTLICQECLEGYIVASDFQSCISNKNFLYDYKYCKRLDSNNQCDEGLCSIYIDQYGNFFSETEYYDPRCAKVDKINNICLRPRFPFTLVQDDNSFYYEDNYFCQIQNANKDCIKRYGGFQQQNGYKSFIMPINNNFPNQNCQISNCKRCGLINNLQELQYCQECQSNFYSNYNLLCDVNCIQDPVSQKCIYCILPDNILRVGDQCQNKLKEVPNCIKSNSIGVCIQCNEGYFYHIQNQACQERVASKQNCKLVNPISDQCLTPECQVGFSLSQQFENDFYYTQSQQYDSINVFLLPSEYLQKILQDPKQYKLQNQIISIDIPDNQDVKMIMQDFYYTNSINQMCVNTPNLIDGCIQYLGNLCVQCENNKIYYQYMPKTDSNGLFYKSYCGESQNLGVENCLLFKNNQCLKCIDTFYLDGGQCLQNPISNCMIIVKGSDGQTFQCSQCQKGYQYNSQLNSCVIIPKNCIDYQCSQCIDNINYQLNINTQQNTRSCFQIKQQQPQFEPCQQKTDGQCTQCNYGTLLQNGQCVLNQSPCLRFSDNKKCLECQANYTLFKGMCYYSDPLSYCNKSRYYQNSSGYVSKCDFNPNAYETENGPNCIENQNCKEGEYKDETGQCQQCKFNTPSRQIKKCYKNFSLDINAYYDEKTNQAWNELYNKYFPICLNGRHLINNNSVCSYNVQLKYPKIIKNQITQKYINQFPTSDDDISQEIQFDDKKNQYFCPQKVWLQQAWQDSLSKCQIQVQNFCYQGFVFEGGICQFKCGNGLISFSEDGCATSEQCQQGMQWQNELKTCIYLCGDGLVAFNNMSCATTTTCQMSDQNEKSPERCFNYIQINKSYTYSAGNSYGYLYALIAFLVIALLLSILYIRKLKQEQKIFKNTTVASTQQENKDTESNKESEPLNQKEIIYNNQDNLITIQVNQDDLPEIQSSNEDFRIESKIQRYNNQKTLINQIENKLKQDLEKQINNQFEIELPSDPSSQINFNGIPKYNLKPDHRYSQSSYIQNSNQHMKQKEELQRNQQINNCGIQQIVYSDPQHLNPYIICTECSQGYIVNYDFKSCIKATTLPLGIFQYCKRLDRNRQCDEALCTIQIDQNDLFVRENPYQYDPRCAKIDTINQICISPRFPYTLEIATNQIFHYANSFCKIQYYNGCRQNYETFYQSISNQLYFTLVNFINPDLIDQKTIYKEQIKCLPNFTYQQVSKQFIVEGCYPVSQTCSNVDINGFCKCPDDQAVDSTGSQCLAYQNCQIGYANNINQIKYCIQCKYGYIKQPYQADCTLRCIEDTANQICKYCYTGDQGQLYYGQFCDQVIVSRTDSNCQITNSSTGDCVKCNEQFFYSIIDKICKYRARSNGCQYLNPVSDQCLTLQCAQKYQLSDQLAQILWQKIPKNLNSQFSDPQNVILLKYYLNQYFAQPDTVKSGFFQISNNLIEIFSEKIDLTNLNLLSDIYYYNDIGTNICQPIYYNNQVPNCKTFFAGLCIECENSDVYYQQIGPANPVQTFLYVYNSFCGQSEDWYIPNCKVLSGDMSSCMVCKEGYIFNSSNQCVLGNILNCIFQDSQGNCVFCKQQYVLSNNKCYFISKNCAQYTFDDQKNVLCTACKDTNTFQLVQNTLQKVQSCQLLNPLVYQPCQFKVDGTCKQCDKGTTLNQQTYQCDINQDNPYYCQSPVGSNSNLCNQCQNGYILDKGICFPQSGSCSYYKPLSTSYQNICDYENPQNPQNQLCQFFNQQGQYLAYDQNYKIFVQKSCNITDSQNCFKCSLNMCLDTPDTCGVGKGWSKTFNQCFEQCLDDKLLIDLPQNPQKMCNYKRRCDISKNIISNMFQCSDCSLVKTIYECIPQQQNSVQCQNNYFFQKGQCMYNCGKGKISYDQSQCQYSQLCQEGLTWSYEYNQCVYKECNKNITAVNQSCLKQQKIQIIQSQLPNDYRFSKYYVGLAVILVFLVLLPIFYFVILKMATKLHQQTRTFIKQLRLVKNAQQMNNVQNSDKNIQTSFSYKQNSQDKIEVPLDEQNITGIIVQTSSNNIPSKQNIVEEAKNKQNQIEINIQMYTEQDQDVGSPSNLVQIQSHRRENSGSLFNQVENQS